MLVSTIGPLLLPCSRGLNFIASIYRSAKSEFQNALTLIALTVLNDVYANILTINVGAGQVNENRGTNEFESIHLAPPHAAGF